jgi:acyl-coenzyme A thioesterase PaaI-like protein
VTVSREDLTRVLAGASFQGGYGFRVRACGDGECTLEVPFRPLFERPGGVVSGPVFMAAADATMWLAIMTRLGVGRLLAHHTIWYARAGIPGADAPGIVS